MRAALLALVLAAAGAMPAAACNNITDAAGSSCANFADITGNLEADRCPIAMAEVDQDKSALRQLRDVQPGQPVWSQAYVQALLNEAQQRVARYCGNAGASLP